MRALIQSTIDFHFLHSSPVNGDIGWTPSLLTALVYGMVTDEEQAAQLVADHADRGHYIVIDLDNVPEPR
jgi:hypothetical protein|nr:MAG TPA: hypothetical protein [Inoviridae sp.]